MIQRKQTLFLLGSVIISALLFYMPIYELLSGETNETVKEFSIPMNALLLILNGAVGALSLIAILLFKTRNLQIRLCNLALLLDCVFIGLLFFWGDTMSSGTDQKIRYLFGSYLPLIQVLLIFLATVYIRKDEKLVRSADRLR